MVPILLIWIVGITSFVSALYLLIGALLYDIRRAEFEREYKPTSRRFRRRPVITLILETENNESQIADSLQHILGLPYKKTQLLVIDYASKDATKRIVREHIKSHPKANIRLVAKRNMHSRDRAVQDAFKRYGAGEIVARLGVNERFNRGALHNALRYFQRDELLEVLMPVRHVMATYSLAGLLQQYAGLWRQYEQRSRSRHVMRPAGQFYRRDALMNGARMQNEVLRTQFASDVGFIRVTADSWWQVIEAFAVPPRSLGGIPARLLALLPRGINMRGLRVAQEVFTRLYRLMRFLILSYFIYVAVGLHEPFFLAMTLVAVTLWSLLIIWKDELLSSRQKLQYSCGIPLTYIFWYLLLGGQLIYGMGSQLRSNFSIGNIRSLAGRLWVYPGIRPGQA